MFKIDFYYKGRLAAKNKVIYRLYKIMNDYCAVKVSKKLHLYLATSKKIYNSKT